MHPVPVAVRVLALLAACAGPAAAQTPSTGAWPGTPAPAAPAVAAAQPGGGAPRVALELRTRGHVVEATAVNALAGPVEVELQATGFAPRADPPLPARVTVPAFGRVLVARLDAAATGAHLRLPAVPGLPTARPRDATYLYPLRNAPVRISQGFGGAFSHDDEENRHAVDFVAPAGTPVLAARDGVVMQVADDATGRVDPRIAFDPGDDRVRGNFIRILHDDGTMALYAHLQTGGVIVTPGARVLRGTIIGFSGNTGLSTAPHLHFVLQANRGMRLASLPFRMSGPDGPLPLAAVSPALPQ